MSHTTEIKSIKILSVSALEACVRKLKAAGHNVSLEYDAKPRMYYADQVQRQIKKAEDAKEEKDRHGFNWRGEICDAVIRVHDAFYDIALLKNKDNELVPYFDAYEGAPISGDKTGTMGICKVLGQEFDGTKQHWAGAKAETEETLHCAGKFFQTYTECALTEEAERQGYSVTGLDYNDDGSMRMRVTVS